MDLSTSELLKLTPLPPPLLEVDITSELGPGYAVFVEDVLRMVCIQLTIQVMIYCSSDPANPTGFATAQFFIMLAYVVLGVALYWLVLKRVTSKLKDAEDDTVNPIDPCRFVFSDGRPRITTQDQHIVTLGTSLYSDVDFQSLIHVFDSSSTVGGRACLRALLYSPIADVSALIARQSVLSSLASIISGPNVSQRIRTSLQIMKEMEPDVAWTLRHPHQDDEMRALYDLAFFKMWPLHHLNDSPVALTALNLHRIAISPIIGILSPLVYFIIPYLILRFRVGVKVSLFQYLHLMRASMSLASSMYSSSAQYASLGFSLLFYFQGVFSSLEMSSTLSAVCSTICRRSRNIEAFKTGARDLLHICSPLGASVSNFFPETGDFTSYGHRTSSVKESDRPMLLRNFGQQLNEFKCIDLNDCTRLLRDAYAADALCSVCYTKDILGACNVDFIVSKSPRFEATDLKHPGIPASRSVPNCITMLDGPESASAALLTGPNAGGKSTLLKSMLLATITAQTLTIAPCMHLRMTPYSHIHSHINVPDIQGTRSLFEAEMDRARESMDVLARMSLSHPDRFSLIIMDEVFSSTNPIEGIAGAYSVSKKLASSRNATVVVSTHFLYLRRLAQLRISNSADPLFQLLQMPVEILKNKTFKYPYRVHPGVCEQLVALELLRESGFAEDVMTDALEIKRTLLAPPGRQRKPGGGQRQRKQTESQPLQPPLLSPARTGFGSVPPQTGLGSRSPETPTSVERLSPIP